MSTATDAKAPTVTVTLTVTYQAEPNMTLKQFAAQGEKAEAMKAKLKEYGAVEGSVTIGKQSFKV